MIKMSCNCLLFPKASLSIYVLNTLPFSVGSDLLVLWAGRWIRCTEKVCWGTSLFQSTSLPLKRAGKFLCVCCSYSSRDSKAIEAAADAPG